MNARMYLLQWIVILASMYFGFIGLKHAQKLKQTKTIQTIFGGSFKAQFLSWVYASNTRLRIFSVLSLLLALSVLIFSQGWGRGIVEFFLFSAVILFLLILANATQRN